MHLKTKQKCHQVSNDPQVCCPFWEDYNQVAGNLGDFDDEIGLERSHWQKTHGPEDFREMRRSSGLFISDSTDR